MPICVGSNPVEIRVVPDYEFRALLLHQPGRRTLEQRREEYSTQLALPVRIF
jgi:hypothetical protein